MKKFLLLLMIFGVALFAVACNKEEAPHEHTFSEEWSSDDFNHWHGATCEHTDEKADFTGHFWGAGEVTTEPTCTAKGVRTFTCSTCGKTKTEEMKMLEHEWEYAVSEEDSTKHTISCANCDATKEAAAHDYTEVLTPATCTTYGKTEYTCETCGHSYVVEHTEEGYDPENHTEEWIVAEGKWGCCDAELYSADVNKVAMDGLMRDTVWSEEVIASAIPFNHPSGNIKMTVYAVRNDKGLYFFVEYKTRELHTDEAWWKSDNFELRIVGPNGKYKIGNDEQIRIGTKLGDGGCNFTSHYTIVASEAVDEYYNIVFETFVSYEALGVTDKTLPIGFEMGSNPGGNNWFCSTEAHSGYGVVWNSATLRETFLVSSTGIKAANTTTQEECGAQYNHFFDAGKEIVHSDCVNDTTLLHTCKLCAATKESTVPTNGEHYFNKVVVVTPGTCTTSYTYHLQCTGCEETKTEEPLIGEADYDNHTGTYDANNNWGRWSCCNSALPYTVEYENTDADYNTGAFAFDIVPDENGVWEVTYYFRNIRTTSSTGWGHNFCCEIYSIPGWSAGGWSFRSDWCGWGAWTDGGKASYTDINNGTWADKFDKAAADMYVVMNIKFDRADKSITVTMSYTSNVDPFSAEVKHLTYKVSDLSYDGTFGIAFGAARSKVILESVVLHSGSFAWKKF